MPRVAIIVEPDTVEQSAVDEAPAEAAAELPPSAVETDPDGGGAGHAR